MPDELFSADGSKFFIGGALSTKKAAFVAGDYTAQTFVEVDLWQGGSVSSLGAREVATNRVLNRDIPIKTAGGGDPGTMELVFLWKGTDAGQIDLAEATVKIHIRGILRALNVTTRTEALVKLTEMGVRFSDSDDKATSHD
jgi:hypothetical protein